MFFCQQQIDPDWFLPGESHHLPDTASNTNQVNNLPQRHERLERYKDSFELDFDQVRHNQRLLQRYGNNNFN